MVLKKARQTISWGKQLKPSTGLFFHVFSQINEVEDEMRQILQEAASGKKTLEMRIKKLTNAFNEIQEDLAS